MSRYALAFLFSLLHVFFSTSTAWSKDIAKKAAPVRKHTAKKSSVPKRDVHIGARSTKHRTSYRPLVKAVTSSNLRHGIKAVAVRRKHKVMHTYVPLTASKRRTSRLARAGNLGRLDVIDDPLDLRSNAALVWDTSTSEVLFEKESDAVRPIASISKLMTALVVVEAHQDMSEVIEVTADDIDRLKHTSSRLQVGSRLTRDDMLHIALMSSENRAASALGRNYPGGLKAFVAAMNAKAKALGMLDTHYVEPTGLSSRNVSSARDLAKLVIEAQKHSLIREYSTNREYAVDPGGPSLHYRNSNRLVTNPQWDIVLQKTGYISEAGRCLVMQTMIKGRPIVMVLLDSQGKFSRATDAGRVRKWLEAVKAPQM